MVIMLMPNEPVKSDIRRTDDLNGSELFMIIGSRFKISVKHKFFRAVTFSMPIKLRVDNIRIVEKAKSPELLFIAVKKSNIEI